jgi:hypothetical protein
MAYSRVNVVCAGVGGCPPYRHPKIIRVHNTSSLTHYFSTETQRRKSRVSRPPPSTLFLTPQFTRTGFYSFRSFSKSFPLFFLRLLESFTFDYDH